MNTEKIKWNDQAAAALLPVMGNDAPVLRSEVQAGRSELHRIDGNSYMITRLEGDRLIVPCFIGENLKQVAAAIYAAAKKVGCRSIQFHTERPGLQRLLADFGPVCIGQYYIFETAVE